jgi:hypothetical protein
MADSRGFQIANHQHHLCHPADCPSNAVKPLQHAGFAVIGRDRNRPGITKSQQVLLKLRQPDAARTNPDEAATMRA